MGIVRTPISAIFFVLKSLSINNYLLQKSTIGKKITAIHSEFLFVQTHLFYFENLRDSEEV